MRIVPSNFRADPLGYGGNFAGHLLIAGIFIGISSLGWFVAFGEYPYKWAVAAAWVALYLSIELPQKGSKWPDRIDDIVVSCIHGPMIYLRPFSEVEAGSAALSVQSLTEMAPYLGLALAHLATGATVRLLQAHKEGRDI